LSNAVINISKDYASWIPEWLLRSGIARLPSLLKVPAAELDTTTVLARHPDTALFIAGAEDKVTPPADVEKLRLLASPESRMIVVPGATHEAVTYFFPELLPPVSEWLMRDRDLFKSSF
jgi:pimeloyl-ACP methyl ester carboxylesterase